MKITILLDPITKKNSQEIHKNNKTGAYFVAPSRRFKEYEANAGYFLANAPKVAEYPVNVKCLFYLSTRRRCDLTNLLEAVDDVLVNYGIIQDDSYKYLAAHDGSRVLYDKNNPRTEIYISRLEEIPRGNWLVDICENVDYMTRRGWRCSVCNTRQTYGKPNYCPTCGAQMSEEGEK